jgi:hypothetical protein
MGLSYCKWRTTDFVDDTILRTNMNTYNIIYEPIILRKFNVDFNLPHGFSSIVNYATNRMIQKIDLFDKETDVTATDSTQRVQILMGDLQYRIINEHNWAMLAIKTSALAKKFQGKACINESMDYYDINGSGTPLTEGQKIQFATILYSYRMVIELGIDPGAGGGNIDVGPFLVFTFGCRYVSYERPAIIVISPEERSYAGYEAMRFSWTRFYGWMPTIGTEFRFNALQPGFSLIFGYDFSFSSGFTGDFTMRNSQINAKTDISGVSLFVKMGYSTQNFKIETGWVLDNLYMVNLTSGSRLRADVDFTDGYGHNYTLANGSRVDIFGTTYNELLNYFFAMISIML